MAKQGPVILFEEDELEIQVIIQAFKKLQLPNKIHAFNNGDELLNYLYTTKEAPFIIISDIGDHVINGLELRRKINADEYLRKKSIPFVFLTDVKSKKAVAEAFEMSVQGYFLKQNTIADLEIHLRRIIDYWMACYHPNNTFD